jgi:hypothetical protein
MTGSKPTVLGDPAATSRRLERSARIAAEIKRGFFFALILVVVAFVIFEFVSEF